MAFTLTPRLSTMRAQWARTAQTDIPVPPVPGSAYRNTALSVPEIESGQAYDKVYDSARHNEMLHQVTGMALESAMYGIPRYSELTDYPAGGLCLGLDGSLYQALMPNGPNTGGVGVKGTDDATYWSHIPLDELPALLEAAEGFLTDAPEDGKLYGRQNGEWTEIEIPDDGGGEPGGGEGGISFPDSDGNYYAAKDGAWANITNMLDGSGGGISGVPEAPSNGTAYVRKNEGWTSLPSELTALGYTPGGGGEPGGGGGITTVVNTWFDTASGQEGTGYPPAMGNLRVYRYPQITFDSGTLTVRHIIYDGGWGSGGDGGGD